LIELLVVLVFLLSLHVLASGFELSISLVEIIVWGIAGVLLAIVGPRLLIGKVTDNLMGAGRRKRGPAADGLAHLRQGDLDAAEFALRRCLERNPADVEALQGLAEVASRRGDFEQYIQLTSKALGKPDALRRNERVALCHRQADVCLGRLNDRKRAVEALARIELDYPGTTDAWRAKQRIERILSESATETP